MYDLIKIGAGPGGIALAAEACASGINQSQILVLEKGATHTSAIRQLYPDQKLTTANYKGFDARCEGLLFVSDMTKSETIDLIESYTRLAGLRRQISCGLWELPLMIRVRYSMRPVRQMYQAFT